MSGHLQKKTATPGIDRGGGFQDECAHHELPKGVTLSASAHCLTSILPSTENASPTSLQPAGVAATPRLRQQLDRRGA